jgi:glycosyltransferase involved in cell wall biosynthesis
VEDDLSHAWQGRRVLTGFLKKIDKAHDRILRPLMAGASHRPSRHSPAWPYVGRSVGPGHDNLELDAATAHGPGIDERFVSDQLGLPKGSIGPDPGRGLARLRVLPQVSRARRRAAKHSQAKKRYLPYHSHPIRTPVRVKRRVLIIVQNLPVPFDRRVWLECQALVSAGYRVAVVCPKGSGDPSYEVINTVELYKYRLYAPGGSKFGFVAEYACSFLATAWLMLKARRSGRFAVIQACNPPDIFWPLALVFRALEGTRFVHDHHDLCPELYESRFPSGPRLPYKGLRALERRTHRAADHVIATNDSYREIAITRSGKSASDVTVVRTGPDPQRLRRGEICPELRRGRNFLAAYIGVMGPQDGVDIVIRAADVVVHELKREDIAFTLIGSGDCFDDLVALRDELGLAGHVEFTGRVPDQQVSRILSTADVGLCPDPKSPLNDLSTMNKTMEYMAFELPVVAFDLRETRVSAGDAAVYVKPNDVHDYAAAIVELMDDESRRSLLGKLGRDRVEQKLAWHHQERAYLGVYHRLTAGTR